MLRVKQVEPTTAVVLAALNLTEGGTEGRKMCVYTPTFREHASRLPQPSPPCNHSTTLVIIGLHGCAKNLHVLPLLARLRPLNSNVGLQEVCNTFARSNQHGKILPKLALNAMRLRRLSTLMQVLVQHPSGPLKQALLTLNPSLSLFSALLELLPLNHPLSVLLPH